MLGSSILSPNAAVRHKMHAKVTATHGGESRVSIIGQKGGNTAESAPKCGLKNILQTLNQLLQEQQTLEALLHPVSRREQRSPGRLTLVANTISKNASLSSGV